MLTLRLRFPAGRYHATPFGHHVNEGIVEWPPSPWRLLRALIARGYTSLGWREVPEAGRRLLMALASKLPRYRLPPAVIAHSRHYMPVGTLAKGRESTTLVFDAWADVGNGELLVGWDVDVDDECRSLMARLTGTLDYLGRSESWVEGELLDPFLCWPGGEDDAYPHGTGDRSRPGWELVTLMAPLPATDYAAWRRESTEPLLAITASGGRRGSATRKAKAERARIVAPYPIDLVAALECDTAWWRQHRWSQPPGSQRVLYWRRSDALAVTVPVLPRRQAERRVEAMLLSLTTPSGRTSALPTLGRTLPQAELLHRALISFMDGSRQGSCPELIGRDEHRRPLQGHVHAHIVPLDLGGGGRIDHVLVYARMGLGPEAQAIIRRLRRIWTKGGVGEIRVAVAGVGSLDDLRALPDPYGQAIERLLGPPGGARDWRSETVFVPPRHMKHRGRNTLEGQVREELAGRGFPPAEVEVLPWDATTLHHRHTKRVRRSPAAPPPVDIGFVLRLAFAERVRGPLLLGYASHFGLGRFGALA